MGWGMTCARQLLGQRIRHESATTRLASTHTATRPDPTGGAERGAPRCTSHAHACTHTPTTPSSAVALRCQPTPPGNHARAIRLGVCTPRGTTHATHCYLHSARTAPCVHLLSTARSDLLLALLLVQLLLVELQLGALQDVAVRAADLAGAGRDAGEQTAAAELLWCRTTVDTRHKDARRWR